VVTELDVELAPVSLDATVLLEREPPR